MGGSEVLRRLGRAYTKEPSGAGVEEGEEESAVVAKMRREEDWDVMCKWTFVWRLFESGKETWIGSAVEAGRVPFGGEVEVMVPLNFCGFEMDFLWDVCFYECWPRVSFVSGRKGPSFHNGIPDSLIRLPSSTLAQFSESDAYFAFYSENTAGHIIVCFNPGALPHVRQSGRHPFVEAVRLLLCALSW